MVYPTFLTAIAQNTAVINRAESIGTFRLWRDLGYAIGALFSSLVANYFGIHGAIWGVGLITLISASIIKYRFPSK
jgi:hypothetical protein